MLDIVVVILNYNGYADTIECIKSVRASTYKCRLIVIDNASPRNDAELLSAYLNDDEMLLRASANLGYAGGCNLGLDFAFRNGADAVFVLNNDTWVDANCLAQLISALNLKNDIGIVGPKILFYDDPLTVAFAGITVDPKRVKYERLGYLDSDSGQFESLIPTSYQEGCALLITRNCYNTIGGFDVELWSYWEENDLCFRARSKGFEVMCQQSAKVWHKVSASFGDYYNRSPAAVYFQVRNWVLFHRRYAGNRIETTGAILRILSRVPRQALGILIKGKRNRIKNFRIYILAMFVGLFSNKWQPSDMFSPIKVCRDEAMKE